MLSAIKQFFSPPIFPHNEEKTRLTKVLYILVTSLLIATVLALIVVLFIYVQKTITTIFILIALGILLTINTLLRRGHLRLGSFLYISMLWGLATVGLYIGSGTSSPELGLYMALTVTAGILLGVEWAVALAILNVLVVLGFALLEINGYPFPHLYPEPSLTRWFDFSIMLLLTIAPIYLILTSLTEALGRIQQENEQRKEVERLLRESETRLRNISDNLPGGMTYQLDMGLNGEMRQFTYVSAGVEKLHEVSAESVLQDAQILYGQIFEEDLPLVTAQETQAQAAMTTFSVEVRFRLPSGAMRWYLLTSAPRRASNGHLLWDGVEMDITERKQVEQALTDEVTRRRILVEQSRDGIVILDQDGHVYESNQKFADMLGYPLGEMRKLSVFDWEFLYPRERVIEMIRTVDEMGDHFETKHRRRDGSIYDVEISTNAALFAGQKLIFCVCRDITERKQAEEALRHERDVLGRFMETSPVGIAVVDCEGQITFANRHAEQIFGLTKDQITQRTYNAPTWRITDYDGNPFPDEDLPFSRVMTTGQPVHDVRHAIEWPDGRRVLLSINTSPLFSETGQLDGMVAAIDDITERVRAEGILQESEARFQAMFKEHGAIMLMIEPGSGQILDVNAAAAEFYGSSRVGLRWG